MLTLRWYQIEAVNSIYNYYASGKSGNPIVAMPTGTGKSLVPADFIHKAMQCWPDQRFMMLTHVKQLIKQNADKMLKAWPHAPLGIYSAGLGKKQVHCPIVFGGVASVKNAVRAFGKRDIVFIDECHLVSPDAATMYGQVRSQLTELNPNIKFVGLSATPYRMKQGVITDGGLFTDICYDITNIEGFKRLIEEGYLSPLITKRGTTQIDLSEVGISQGDFKKNELEKASNKERITYGALEELLSYSHDRHCGVIFTSGVDHAEAVYKMLTEVFSERAVIIHSKKGDAHNDKSLQMWREGWAKWAVNVNCLTTGIDVPQIDIIGVLRATMSPGLWVQMLGRGTRPFNWGALDLVEQHRLSYLTGHVKSNCLCLDFAGNARLGTIDDPVIPKSKVPRDGDMPVRICDNCNCYNHCSARACVYCGHIFEIKVKFKEEAAIAPVMASVEPPDVETFDVGYVIYNRHHKDGGIPSMRVTYFCNNKRFDEWVCFEHTGYPRRQAAEWWRKRHIADVPSTTDEALVYIKELRAPKRIKVWTNKKPLPEIMGYEY